MAYPSNPANMTASGDFHKPAHSTAPVPKDQRSFLGSQRSIETDNTIQAFLLKDTCGHIVKTKKLLEKEQDRVEKVKRVREKSL